ncbi:MAG TPA: type II toxin-antitoxin system prevent-host-death family antitoxin [Stellaceae bacterium]|jgi:prevent-host-death family protein|nr:type II toxin-antitoxin system prevent-host-death family antitoxin [Stellaceae bacterium]
MVRQLDHLRQRNYISDMTAQFNIAEAKAKLSELLDRALTGEEIVIARAGKPLARLAPVASKPPRKPGAWKHWNIPDDIFLEPMDPEDLDAAEGKFTDEFGISLPADEP